jgi:DNA polymerase I
VPATDRLCGSGGYSTLQLLLIDGNHIMYSVLYRHIAKAKKRGDYEEATDRIVEKACQQFTITIRKLARRFRLSHMLVIFDNDGQNFRHRLSPIYKANRKERPKEVHPLKQEIYKRFREEGIPYMYATDYEGDDLIGTIAEWAEEVKRCQKVVLVSGDADLAQLVTTKTHLYLVKDGIFSGTWITPRNMKAVFDVEPLQLPALKALLGDRTDNIKGVSGLRRPHVLKLIERYPDLSEFLELPKGANKTEALVLRHREHVQNNLLLANIRRDLRFYLRWDDLRLALWLDVPGASTAGNEEEGAAAGSAGTATAAPAPQKRKPKQPKPPKQAIPVDPSHPVEPSVRTDSAAFVEATDTPQEPAEEAAADKPRKSRRRRRSRKKKQPPATQAQAE